MSGKNTGLVPSVWALLMAPLGVSSQGQRVNIFGFEGSVVSVATLLPIVCADVALGSA